jgi:hypothetical protein
MLDIVLKIITAPGRITRQFACVAPMRPTAPVCHKLVRFAAETDVAEVIELESAISIEA